MPWLRNPDDPIRTTRGQALDVLKEALTESLTLAGGGRTEEYAALAIDLTDALVRRTKPEATGQRQDSLADQLQDLIPIAALAGMYDAADWIRRTLSLAAEARAAERLFGSVTGRVAHDRPNIEDVER